MSLVRGNFVLVCNRCGEEHDLGTKDFDEAKELAAEHKEQFGWTTVQRGGKYADLCGGCT